MDKDKVMFTNAEAMESWARIEGHRFFLDDPLKEAGYFMFELEQRHFKVWCPTGTFCVILTPGNEVIAFDKNYREITLIDIQPARKTRAAWLLDVLSIGGSMVGSLLLASNTDASKWGYVAFSVGAAASLAITMRSNVSRSQVWLNGWFLFMNAFGLARWFGVL